MTVHGTTGPAAVRLTRDGLAGLRRRLYDGRNRTKAVIDRVDLPSGTIVVKDVAPRPFWVRALLGPWQLGREVRAYERLAGLEGVPRLVGIIDRQAIALEFVDGRPLSALTRGSVGGEFFDRLDHLIRSLHHRGVAHGDLHHGDVLAGPHGQPFVVDFSTSWIGGQASLWPARLIFAQMCRADLRSVAKLRSRYGRDSTAPPPPSPWLYRAAGSVRDALRRTVAGRRGGPPRRSSQALHLEGTLLACGPFRESDQ